MKEEIASQYYRVVKTYFLKRVGNREEAGDLTQDVFLKVIQSGQSFTELQNISGWIMTIAHNRLVDHYRKHKMIGIDSEQLHDLKEAESVESIYPFLEKCLESL